MAPHEPILLICHGFPPVRGIGGRRWAKFAKELARRGHPVHVIRNAGTPDRLDSLWTADGMQPGIIHHPLPQRYPGVITKRPITRLADKVMYRAWRKLLPWMVPGNIYDSAARWKHQLVAEGGRLVREHGIRNVIATGAPFSMLAHAAALKQSNPDIHLVADFRDEWTWGGNYGMGSMKPARLKHERDMEALVVKESDRVISPHAPVIAHLRNTYGGPPERYAALPHAIDPEDFDAAPLPGHGDNFRMIYAGSLYGANEAERYFGTLLNAFEALRRSAPDAFAHCRLDLYITGHGTAAYAGKVKERALDGHIRFHAPLPPKEMLREVARSRLVLAFIPSINKDVAGTKFNEFFFLGVPVLHVGEPGLVSRTIRERRMGDSLRVEELVAELPRIITGERTISMDRYADHSACLLGPLTDRLVNEVLA